MALQNAMQRAYLPDIPSTTFMTRNTIQVVIDGIDLLQGIAPKDSTSVRKRFAETAQSLSFFCARLRHGRASLSLDRSVVSGHARGRRRGRHHGRGSNGRIS